MPHDIHSGRERDPQEPPRVVAAVWLVAALAMALSLTVGCAARDRAASAPAADIDISRPAAGAWVEYNGALTGPPASEPRTTREPAQASGSEAGVVDSALPPQRHERPSEYLNDEWGPAPVQSDDGALYPLNDGTFAGAPVLENRDPGIGGSTVRDETGLEPDAGSAAELLPLPNGSSPDAENPISTGAKEQPAQPAWSVSYEPRGIVITIDDGLFAPGRASPVPSGAKAMDEIAAFMGGYPGRLTIVESHTDSSGPAPANMQLSRKRAEVVRAGLIARGFAAQQLEARPYGEAYPAASNASDEGRLRNDRIELVLVPPGQSGEASYRETLEASAGDFIPY